MLKGDSSDSESQENNSDSSSEEVETPRNGGTQKISEYEKQRIKTIEENRARMEALGLHKMANSFMGSVQKTKKNSEPKKGKRRVVEEDEEYRPPEGNEGLSSSSEQDEDDDDDVGMESSGSGIKKAKKKNTTPKKMVPVQKPFSKSDFVDADDDALMQAIALSLQDSEGFLDVANSVPSQNAGAHLSQSMTSERKGKCIEEDTGKRKRKKSISSRVQMTEDELILHFFQLDEAGKGGITPRDLRRVAAAHDFTWTDKEMADMIYCFDNDRDGKVIIGSNSFIYDLSHQMSWVNNLISGEKKNAE